MMIPDKDTKYTKLFVGGIPYTSDDDALRNFFGDFGEIIEAVVIRDRVTKKSKGYGFVSRIFDTIGSGISIFMAIFSLSLA